MERNSNIVTFTFSNGSMMGVKDRYRLKKYFYLFFWGLITSFLYIEFFELGSALLAGVGSAIGLTLTFANTLVGIHGA